MRDEDKTRQQLLYELNRLRGKLQGTEARYRQVKEALKYEEKRIRLLLEEIPAWVCMQAPDHTLRWYNRRFVELFGEPRGRRCYEVIRRRDKPCEPCPTFQGKSNGRWEYTEPVSGKAYAVYESDFLDMEGAPLVLKIGVESEGCGNPPGGRARMPGDPCGNETCKPLFETHHAVMLLIDPDSGVVVDGNPSACEFYGYPRERLRGMSITDINILTREEVFEEMAAARAENRRRFLFRHRLSSGVVRDVEVFSGPVVVGGKSLLCSIVHDVSERRAAETERERLIEELRRALGEVKTLRGFMPICAQCKNIRDDKGYWNRIEAYLKKHSEIEFTHGICPACAEKLYGDEDWYDGEALGE